MEGEGPWAADHLPQVVQSKSKLGEEPAYLGAAGKDPSPAPGSSTRSWRGGWAAS